MLNKKWIPFMVSLLFRVVYPGLSITNVIHIATGLYYLSNFAVQSIKNLKYKIIGIDFLITIATLGALLIGEYWEAASVTFLFVFGNALEKNALYRTQDHLREMLTLVDPTVRRENNELITLEQLMCGDTIKLIQGDVIPADGLIINGTVTVNEASITGESLPSTKGFDELVYMGSIVEEGYCIVKVTALENDTVYGQIIDLIETAQDRKSKMQRNIDRFSQYYTPLVIVVSILVLLVKQDLHIALSLLVVACPGALVIAVPIASVIALGKAARANVLIKGVDVLEVITNVKYIAFDKTGTLTNNALKVIEVIPATKNIDEILKLAASVEIHSEHPIAEAIVKETDYQKLVSINNVEFITGCGLVGTFEGTTIRVGQESLFPYELQTYNETTVYVGSDEELYGTILLRDTVREDAHDVIHQLAKYHVMMLTGDNQETATDIGKQLGISEVHARLLPHDKLTTIKKYQNIMMVGDGINDSPSLMEADVGVSIGGSDNRVAMESSDVILMDKNLYSLIELIKLAHKSKRIMYQNIIIALLTTVILFRGVLSAQINLSLGMLIHEASIVLVIINALRLRR